MNILDTDFGIITKIGLGVSIGGMFHYLGIDQVAISFLVGLMTLDSITGIGASWINKSEDVTSNRMVKGLIKKIATLCIPLALAFFSKGYGIDLSFVIIYCIGIMLLSELYSIISNIYNINTGKKLPESVAIEKLMLFLSGFITEMINKNLSIQPKK